ncbi:hypothetical protein ACET3Z_024669 [Daucus carota]
MSCSLSFHIPKALPSLSAPQCRCLSISSQQKQSSNSKLHKKISSLGDKAIAYFSANKTNLSIQAATLLTTVAQPALAVTGVNEDDDLISVLIALGISAFVYFLVAPPIIMNWLRIRWYRRNVYEMYLQFMFVFLFFPGLLLWAPFLNFRKFPRDPDMKYPWSTPKDPSKIKNDYLKYPWATLEDYDNY